jgi:Kelch motif
MNDLQQAINPGLMKTVSIYDVATGSWYSQQTTGDAPGGLTQGCTVVASAPDGSSHNIYWYGGFDGIDVTRPFSSDVFVLSVPAFVWTKVYSDNSTQGRAGHKCVKPYPDQMFVIGGYPSLSGTQFTCVEGGLVQVFNLSSATWMTSYDPAVWSNYSVPSAVTQNIGGNGAGGATHLPSTWSNQSLSKLFSTPYDSTKIKNWYPYSIQQSNGSNPRQTAQPTPVAVSSGLPSWVAPVLGVVLGLVFISVLIVCILFWRRRRYLRRDGSLAATSDVNRYRTWNWVRGNEVKTPTVTSEDSPSSPGFDEVESAGAGSPHVLHAEAAGTQIYEMAGKSAGRLTFFISQN